MSSETPFVTPDTEERPSVHVPPAEVPKHIRAVCNSETYKVKARTLIICLDGTGDKFDGDNSNIVHIVSCLKKDDPSQVVYYQSGIGTYDGGGLSNGLNAAMDMAVGSGLGVHIKDAYMFLMQAYNEGDKICLFGFSRGAYTARCLAGMIHKVGLLPAHNVSQVQFAYEFYKDDSPAGWKSSRDFKKTFCVEVNVHFVGVFDSVASVGLIPRKLPLSSTPTNRPLYFRHAMGLDERRAKFKISRFQYRDSETDGWKVAAVHNTPSRGIAALHQQQRGQAARNSPDLGANHDHANGHEHERVASPTSETDVLEVWFTGCHADCGGGAVKNEVRHKLSQIPLRWMIRQCFECDTGIIFNTHRLAEEGMDVHTLWPKYVSLGRPTDDPPKHLRDKYNAGEIEPRIKRATSALEDHGAHDNDNGDEGVYKLKIWHDDEKEQLNEHWVPEQVEDYFDAISPLNDQLVDAKGWWVLEYWPIKVRVQPNDSDNWVKKVRCNMGRYRPVQETMPNLHWTVERRIEEMDYQVKARVGKNAKWRVVV